MEALAWRGFLLSISGDERSGPRSFRERRAARELGKAEDHELGRLHRGDPDVDDQLSGIDRFGGVVLAVALHVEGLGRGGAEERAVAPGADQERPDGALHALPEVQVVRLEDDPLRSEQDRLLDVVEEPAHVQVAPGRVARERPGPPHPDAAAREGPDAVDPDRVELVVLGAGQVELERDGAAHDQLNPIGVNCIRTFPGRGIRVWGARTLSSDPAWRYLNVRRLFNYIEE